ncbi:MAG: ArnT family glycosyltransferase [Bacteroidia bacterium]
MKKYPHILITIFTSLLFIPFLGSVHLFDWDEINFAEAAREMILTGNFSRVQINFEPFWEKPPLFFWMQAGSMKLFGINEFAARLPNAVCGIFTLNLLFFYGKKLFNEKLAVWWVLLYVGSFTPHFYFKSGIIDPWFNLFIFLAIVQLNFGSKKTENRNLNFILSGLFLGLALLTKGPVAILIVGLGGLVYLIYSKFKPFFNFKDLLVLIISTLFIPLLWFVPDWINNGFWFTSEFLKYQVDLFLNPVASHGQPWYYHPVVLLIGCFPAAIFALPYIGRDAMHRVSKVNLNTSFVTWMKIMFWVVLILFSMVTTKIVHYSSLCYIPLTFLGAWGLSNSGGIIKLWQKILIGLIGFIYSILFLLIPLISSNAKIKAYFLTIIHDDFVKENILTPTHWFGWEWIFGILFSGLILFSFLYQTKKKLGVKILLIGNALFLFVFSILVIPKVENHVQGSIINFYKSLQGKDIYIETVGFKSYAHYYYTQKSVPKRNDKLNQEILDYWTTHSTATLGQLSEEKHNEFNALKKQWFLNSEIDKPVYLIYKITNTQGMDTNSMFRLVLNSGGYKVYRRDN